MKLHDTYDPKCFALAVAFLADEAPEIAANEAARHRVAVAIQQAVEDACEYERLYRAAAPVTHAEMGRPHRCGRPGNGFACPVCEVLDDNDDRKASSGGE